MAIFDKFASQYDEWYSEKKGSFVDKVETDLAFKMIKIEKNMKILDIGCGTGNFSIKLAKMGCKVTGIDISDEMLEIAKSKATKQMLPIDFIKMDLNDLKFKDNEFDAIISVAAFEFIDDGAKALNEIFRIVKKDGQILVGTIAGDSAWGELYKSEYFQENTVFKYAKFKTLQEMKEWKKENLLETGECLFVSPFSDDDKFNLQTENELAENRKGGYICALWKK